MNALTMRRYSRPVRIPDHMADELMKMAPTETVAACPEGGYLLTVEGEPLRLERTHPNAKNQWTCWEVIS